MEIPAIVFGLLGVIAAGFIYYRFSNQVKEISEKRAELEGRLSHIEARRKKAERRIEEITDRARRLEADLTEAIARRDEKAVATALWNLELERSERQWRDVVLPTSEFGDGNPASVGKRLAFAIQQEVDRLREEVGVSIRFEGDLDCALGPEAALASLRITEELLASASKQADEVSVILDQGEEPSVSIQFICEGWNEEDSIENTEKGDNLKSMAKRLEGWVRYERPSPDELHVSVRLPVGNPVEALAVNRKPVDLNMASGAFTDKSPIPARHAKDTENISPPLQWTDPPDGTVELAVTCHDPDAPDGTFVHWLVAGIDPAAGGVDEGKAPSGSFEGINSYGQEGYGGPLPPEGDKPHRYFFRVHASSKALHLTPGFTDEQLQQALSGNEVGLGTIVGMYQRPAS